MAHLITSSDHLVLVGQPAWHGLGTVLSERDLSAADATREARLGWRVVQQPLTYGDLDGRVHTVEGQVANVRSDNGACLGIVGEDYQPLQQEDIASTIDGVGLTVETAGSLRGGRDVWYLARLGAFGVGAGKADENVSYALFANSHDGQRAFALVPTSVRVVCANTLGVALRTAQASVKIRHTRSLSARVADAGEALAYAREEHALFGELAAVLASKSLTDAERVTYWRDLYTLTVGEVMDRPATAAEERRALHWQRRLAQYRELEAAGTNRVAGIAGTAWAALQVATEAVDHLDPRSGERLALGDEARQVRAWASPDAAKAKRTALDLAAALVR